MVKLLPKYRQILIFLPIFQEISRYLCRSTCCFGQSAAPLPSKLIFHCSVGVGVGIVEEEKEIRGRLLDRVVGLKKW